MHVGPQHVNRVAADLGDNEFGWQWSFGCTLQGREASSDTSLLHVLQLVDVYDLALSHTNFSIFFDRHGACSDSCGLAGIIFCKEAV